MKKAGYALVRLPHSSDFGATRLRQDYGVASRTARKEVQCRAGSRISEVDPVQQSPTKSDQVKAGGGCRESRVMSRAFRGPCSVHCAGGECTKVTLISAIPAISQRIYAIHRICSVIFMIPKVYFHHGPKHQN